MVKSQSVTSKGYLFHVLEIDMLFKSYRNLLCLHLNMLYPDEADSVLLFIIKSTQLRLHALNFLISDARNNNFHVLWVSFLTHASTSLPSASFVLYRFNIPLSLSLCPPVWVHLLTGMQIRIYTAVNKQKKFTLRMGWGGMVVYFQGTKALAVPLVTNTSILRLNLRDNWMEGMGGAAIAEMLKENCYITGGFTVIYCGLNTLCSFFYILLNSKGGTPTSTYSTFSSNKYKTLTISSPPFISVLSHIALVVCAVWNMRTL